MLLELQSFENNLKELSHQYRTAKPFPHIVLEKVVQSRILHEIASKFPKPSDGKWWEYKNILEKKLARNDLESFPFKLQWLIHELQSNRFVSFLEKLTGIEGLIVDHTLNGGGLHQITRGGKLDIHVDYNYHPVTRLDRRLNVLLYLNRDWQAEWGGHLELWNREMSFCIESIAPIFNRMVIFSTSDESNHGHPDPLQCPEGETRKSIALYYYTNGRPEHEISKPHSTIFKKRPQDSNDPEHEELRAKRAVRRLH